MTVVIFWIVAGALLVGAAVLVGAPLWRGARDAGPRQSDANVAIYRRQLAELRQEHSDGVLDARAYRAARDELERRLLEDVDGPADGDSAAGTGEGTPIRSRAGRLTALAVVLVLPVMTLALYHQVGWGPSRVQVLLNSPHQLPEDEFRAAMRGLESRVVQDPENDQAWHMLGRGYAQLDELGKAADAMRRALELRGNSDPELLTELAQVLAFQQSGQSLQGEPRRLLERALEIAPNYTDALWLSGLAAAAAGDTEIMKQRWDRLLAQVEGTPEAEQVRRAITEVLGQQLRGSRE